MPEQINTRYFTPLLNASQLQRTNSGVEIAVDDALLRIDVLAADLMRLAISRNGRFDDKPTFAVSADVSSMSALFDVVENESAFEIVSSAMRIVVERSPFRIDAYRADGSVLFESATLNEWNAAYAFLNDEFVVARRCHKDDAILGLGEKTGRMNRKGRSFTLWNTDILSPNAAGEFIKERAASDPRSDPSSTEFDPYYISIPFFYHLSQENNQAAGFFIDNGYRGRFEFDDETQYTIHFAGGQYTEYIFAGPSMREILGAYTGLTGRMSAPPIWALGYHQCRWYRYTQDTIQAVADHYISSKIPCDTIWLDIDYMDEYRVFTWNTDIFPDVSGMLERFHGQGLRTITIIDPGVKFEVGNPLYDYGVEHDLFCKTEGGAVFVGEVWPGKTVFPDFVQEEARKWWGQLNAGHVQSGLAGIWNDMNEPATGDILCYPMRYDHGKYPQERYHNQYALLMAMGTQEGLLTAMPDKRTFILSRAGFSGIQRYAANWMGDNMARWDHLWLSIPMGLGIGLSGQPFVGADIGGFAENTNAELLVRWVQCGALTPFCRNHNAMGSDDQYPWTFGDAVEAHYKSAIELRYRLMPTLYTAFMVSSETGLPVQRPLVLEYQSDPDAREIDDQFLIGDNLLVAPIYTEGATDRPVYLPAGTWHNWHTNETIAGPKHIVAEAPIEYIPIYARGGTVIPMWPEAPRSTMDYHPAAIELHVFVPKENGEFLSHLHEDDGVTFANLVGAHYRTVIDLRRAGNVLTVKASATGEGYAEFARKEFVIVFHGGAPQDIFIDGEARSLAGDRLHFANSGQGFELSATLVDPIA